MAEDRNFTLKIITSERILRRSGGRMVEFNTTEGQLEYLQSHIPMTAIAGHSHDHD